MRNYTGFKCEYCNQYKGLQTDHSQCSKELQKRKETQTKANKRKSYQSEKRITSFMKWIGK